MIILENDILKIEISPLGAELQSIYGKIANKEYLWQRDAAFWGKSSPVLFPIVGSLKEDKYFFEGNGYGMSRHGFARERDFLVVEQSADNMIFELTEDVHTLKKFPFSFIFQIIYQLKGTTLSTTYRVINNGEEKLLFSVGGHPAFAVDETETIRYADYFLKFEKPENSNRWPISPEGLIEKSGVPLFNNTDTLALSKELFAKDALVLKDLKSTKVALLSTKSSHGIEFTFGDFPFLGIWAAKGANFVCIEPWCGIADSVDSDQDLTHKEGINTLEPTAVFERTWSVRMF